MMLRCLNRFRNMHFNRYLATAAAEQSQHHHHWRARDHFKSHWRDRMKMRQWACRPRFPWVTAGVFAYAGYWLATRRDPEQLRLEEKEQLRLKREHELAMEELRLKYAMGNATLLERVTAETATPAATAAVTAAVTAPVLSTSAATVKEVETNKW